MLWAAAALFRPWGVTPDDFNYEGHFFTTAPFSEDGFDNVMGFSYLYYLALSLVREIENSYASFLVLSSVFVALKMALIARATAYSLSAMFVYVSIFFMLHDIVQFRVGVTSFFYLVAICYFARKERLKSAAAYLTSMLVHSQAAVSPLTLICEKVFKGHYKIAIAVIFLTQLLAQLNLTPPLQSLLTLFVVEDGARLTAAVEQEGSPGFRATSVAIMIFIIFAIRPLRRHSDSYPLAKYAFYSVVAGFILYWVTASSGTLSSRLMQFMWVPLVFLGPLMKKTHTFYFGGIGICICFFVLSGWINGLMSFDVLGIQAP